MPAKSPKNKAAVLPEHPLALVHGDDDFAVSQRARQVYQGWCEDAGGMDHEIIEAAAANAGAAADLSGPQALQAAMLDMGAAERARLAAAAGSSIRARLCGCSIGTSSC